MKIHKKELSAYLTLGLQATSTPPIVLKAKLDDVQSTSSSIGVVSVEGGQVMGVGTDVNGVQVFKGIPFADSTGGANQWKAPQPVKSWSSIKVCDTWGDRVMQLTNTMPKGTFWGDEFYFNNAFTPNTSDSGLNLNVWTPARATSDKLPVVVWIHGGGNTSGNGSELEFYASKLAEKGIIVVDLQYRLGVFGFLATKEMTNENANGSAGNFAVLDLVKGLQWVKSYIAGFGGDPNKVTIAGQSAGAMNVTALLRTPLAKGLFRGAIIQSGFDGLLTPEGQAAYKTLDEQDTANKAAIKTVFGKEMTLAELRALPSDYYLSNTMTATSIFGTSESPLFSGLVNVIEGYTIDGYVFTDDSIDLGREGALDGLNIMIGGCADEYTSLFGNPTGTMDLSDYESVMEATYGADFASVYATPTDTTAAYRLNLRSMSDSSLQKYILSAEYIKAHNKNLRAYVYYQNHTTPGRNSEFYGAWHSSDLWYFFNSLRNQEGQRNWQDNDYKLAEIMSSYYTNFVKTGSPNGEGLTAWSQCDTKTNASFMQFGGGIAESVTATPYPERDQLNRIMNMKSFGLTEADLLFTGVDTEPVTAVRTTVIPTQKPKTGANKHTLLLTGIALAASASLLAYRLIKRSPKA